MAASRFRIFVYTNVLKDYIRSALSLLQLPQDTVLTFDHWCRLFYEEHNPPRLPWDTFKKQPDFDAVRQAVFHKVNSGQVKLPLYDFVLVDEAQDLSEDAFKILLRIAAHVTVCIDNKQQIYEHGCSEEVILGLLGLHRRRLNFIEAFRVCPYLVEVAARLIPDPVEREAFRQQKRTAQTERQTPVLVYARNFEQEKERLCQVVRERQLVNDRIASCSLNRQVFGFAHGLPTSDRGGGPQTARHDQPPTRFQQQPPKLMAFHSARASLRFRPSAPLGLASFPRSAPTARALVFVALTRAAKWAT